MRVQGSPGRERTPGNVLLKKGEASLPKWQTTNNDGLPHSPPRAEKFFADQKETEAA
jgi:hypothetical protein